MTPICTKLKSGYLAEVEKIQAEVMECLRHANEPVAAEAV
jgi:hypothetical protein